MTYPKILIVEDDGDLARALSLRLKASGYYIIRVSDTVQALRQVRLDPPDLILLDLGIPGGDGFVLMDRLSVLPVAVPIIVLTARDPLENKQRSFEAGASAFFQKPVENDALLACIRSHLTPSGQNTGQKPTQEERNVLQQPREDRLTIEPLSALIAGQHN